LEKLIFKEKICSDVYHIKYTFPESLNYKAGQYLGIQINPIYRRVYSIFRAKGGVVEFLIDTSPGGLASQYFESASIGSENLIIGPYGNFFLRQNQKRIKVLVATGTGVVPFLNWLESDQTILEKYKFLILFGARKLEDELVYRFLPRARNISIVHCITREDKPQSYNENYPNCIFFKGRVTDYIEQLDFKECDDVEFYACGSAHTVEDVKQKIREKFNQETIVEDYG